MPIPRAQSDWWVLKLRKTSISEFVPFLLPSFSPSIWPNWKIETCFWYLLIRRSQTEYIGCIFSFSTTKLKYQIRTINEKITFHFLQLANSLQMLERYWAFVHIAGLICCIEFSIHNNQNMMCFMHFKLQENYGWRSTNLMPTPLLTLYRGSKMKLPNGHFNPHL